MNFDRIFYFLNTLVLSNDFSNLILKNLKGNIII